MANPRILIFSDSLALPRKNPEVCLHEDSWPELLRKRGYTVHQVSIGGAKSADLLIQVKYYKSFDPDIIIVQCGIVDCVPRYMTAYEMVAARQIPYLGPLIIKKLNNNTVRKMRKITTTSPAQYKKNMEGIIRAYSKKKVFLIGILPASEAYEKKINGITYRINQYNSLLGHMDGATYIPMAAMPMEGIMSDHHHLNKAGHQYLLEQLTPHLKVNNDLPVV